MTEWSKGRGFKIVVISVDVLWSQRVCGWVWCGGDRECELVGDGGSIWLPADASPLCDLWSRTPSHTPMPSEQFNQA